MAFFDERPPLLKTVNVDELRRDVGALLCRLRRARQATETLKGATTSLTYYGRSDELAATVIEQIDHVEAFLRRLVGYGEKVEPDGDGPLVHVNNPFPGDNSWQDAVASLPQEEVTRVADGVSKDYLESRVGQNQGP